MHATPRSTRRAFLKGQAAVEALTQFDVGAAEATKLPEPLDQRYLVRLSRRAMACTFEAFLNAGQYPHGTAAAIAGLDLIDQLEDQLSIYRESSELSQLNQRAFFADQEVEPRLFALLELATRLHQETHGAYDATAGRLSRVWGFTRRQGSVPPEKELAAALECVGSQYLTLDPLAQLVRFARPGLEINLGGIGKGYALDRFAELLEREGVHDFLLHGGSSSVLARGAHASELSGACWLVGLRNPLRPERRLGTLRLRNRALGTSGSGTQFFPHQGRRLGHILDPRTGWPAEGVLTVSVVAATAAEADALATALYVLGPQAAKEYAALHPDVGYVMVVPVQRAGSLEIQTANLSEDEWQTVSEVPPTPG